MMIRIIPKPKDCPLYFPFVLSFRGAYLGKGKVIEHETTLVCLTLFSIEINWKWENRGNSKSRGIAPKSIGVDR